MFSEFADAPTKIVVLTFHGSSTESMRHFHKYTKLTIIVLMPTVYSQFSLLCSQDVSKLDVSCLMLQTLFVVSIWNGTAKTMLAISAFLY